MASVMKAWQYTAVRGGLEKSLNHNPSATPPSKSSLSKDQILVEVISASINPVDYKIPEMALLAKVMISTPASPGLDFCGRVVAIHTADDTLKEGQLVFGRLDRPCKFGTLGQFIVAPSTGCVALPTGVQPDDAAAVGTAALTAYQSLPRDVVKAGARVFINGGSGGCGVFGIQFAKVLGASVTATCSTGNVELCKSLGADEVIDYKKEDVVEVLKAKGQVFDLAIDNVGVPAPLYTQSDCFLKPGAKFIQVGMSAGAAGIGTILGRALRPGILGGGRRPFEMVFLKNNREAFVQIGNWMVEGKVKAVLDEVFEWEDVPKAYEKLKTGRAKGKIIVHVTEK